MSKSNWLAGWQNVPNFNHSPNKRIRLKRLDHYRRKLSKMLAKSIIKSEVSK